MERKGIGLGANAEQTRSKRGANAEQTRSKRGATDARGEKDSSALLLLRRKLDGSADETRSKPGSKPGALSPRGTAAARVNRVVVGLKAGHVEHQQPGMADSTGKRKSDRSTHKAVVQAQLERARAFLADLLGWRLASGAAPANNTHELRNPPGNGFCWGSSLLMAFHPDLIQKYKVEALPHVGRPPMSCAVDRMVEHLARECVFEAVPEPRMCLQKKLRNSPPNVVHLEQTAADDHAGTGAAGVKPKLLHLVWKVSSPSPLA